MHIRGVQKHNTRLCITGDCAVHHLACIAQPQGNTGFEESVYICSFGVVEYCASLNATLETLQHTMAPKTCPSKWFWCLDTSHNKKIGFKCFIHQERYKISNKTKKLRYKFYNSYLMYNWSLDRSMSILWGHIFFGMSSFISSTSNKFNGNVGVKIHFIYVDYPVVNVKRIS